jgi:hypothetical protein
MQIEYF